MKLGDAAAAKLDRTKRSHVAMIIVAVLVTVVAVRAGFYDQIYGVPTLLGFWICGVAEVWSDPEATESRLARAAKMTGSCFLGLAVRAVLLMAMEAAQFALARLN